MCSTCIRRGEAFNHTPLVLILYEVVRNEVVRNPWKDAAYPIGFVWGIYLSHSSTWEKILCLVPHWKKAKSTPTHTAPQIQLSSEENNSLYQVINEENRQFMSCAFLGQSLIVIFSCALGDEYENHPTRTWIWNRLQYKKNQCFRRNHPWNETWKESKISEHLHSVSGCNIPLYFLVTVGLDNTDGIQLLQDDCAVAQASFAQASNDFFGGPSGTPCPNVFIDLSPDYTGDFCADFMSNQCDEKLHTLGNAIFAMNYRQYILILSLLCCVFEIPTLYVCVFCMCVCIG